MPSRTNKFLAELMLQKCCAVMAAGGENKIAVLHVIVREMSS
jgi:hypothetical protein